MKQRHAKSGGVNISSNNQVGGILAEQRIEFETPRGRVIVRSYGGQPVDCVKDWIRDLVEPGMQQRSIFIDGRPRSEFYGPNKRWAFVHWNDRILVFYAALVDDHSEIARVIRSIRLH